MKLAPLWLQRFGKEVSMRGTMTVTIEVKPYDDFRLNSTLIALPQGQGEQRKQISEPVVLPTTTVADHVVSAAPAYLLLDNRS